MYKPFVFFIASLPSLLLMFCAPSPQQPEVSFPPVDREPLNAIPSDAIVLYDNWQMKESVLTGGNGSEISMPGFAAEDWYSCTVPTTVLGTLVRNGVYPDPYIGMNNMKIPDMNDAFNQRYALARFSHLPDKSNPWTFPYWFRKAFVIPPAYAGKTIWLNLDGINYRAGVWVNGKKVGDAEDIAGMFQRFRLNITDAAVPGEKNAVAICIHPHDFPGDPVHAQLGGVNGSLGPNGGDAKILKNVTQYSAIGWDWVPAARDRNMGIWQHVSLHATGPVVVTDPVVFPELEFGRDTVADLTLRFFVQNVSRGDQQVTFHVSIQPDGFPGEQIELAHRAKIPAESRQELVITPGDYPELRLKEPRLWWPVTHGEQPLYILNVGAAVSQERSSQAQSRFGVRSLDSFILPSGGRAFSVNGKTVRIAGGAWISDYLLSWSARRYRDEIRMMAEGNATLVRVNGCSIMPPDVFYDACDAQGLLVWQDFSRTSVSPASRFDGKKSRRPPACDSTVYMNNMVDVISRIRGRASLLLWCGSNEDAPQEDTGKALQNEVLPRMDGTRIFLPSSSEQPDWSAIDINTYTGGPWHMVDLPRYYEMYASGEGFESKNEIGLPSVPSINTVAAAIPDFYSPDSASFPLNQTMGYHDATSEWYFGAYLERMKKNTGHPSSIAEFIRWGDLYNNRVYRAIFEAANKARPRNQGTVLWKSNAAWPSFMWQLFDWNLRPNAGYYTVKSALKPLHVQFSPPDAGIQVVSTLSRDVNVSVRATVLPAGGKVPVHETFEVSVPANQTVYVDSLTNHMGEPRLYFVSLELSDRSGELLDRTVLWTHENTRWQELLSLPPVDVSCRMVSQKEVKGEVEYTFEVTNGSATPMVNLMLELTGGPFGREILPVFWENNALTMMPGDSMRIKGKVRKDLLPQNPYLLTEGLNVTPAALNLQTGEKEALKYKIFDLSLTARDEKAFLNFSARQTQKKGCRVTTFPVKLSVDGKFIRYVSVGVKPGLAMKGKVELSGLKSGEHRVKLGNGEKTCSL